MSDERFTATMRNHMLDMRAAAGSRAEIPLPARTSPSAPSPHPHSSTRCKPDCDPSTIMCIMLYRIYACNICTYITTTIVISSACDITTDQNHPSHLGRPHYHQHTPPDNQFCSKFVQIGRFAFI